MRHVIVDSLISLDGFFAGPRDEIDWFLFDEESMEWSREILRSAGTVLFGRVTYEGMAEYWPTVPETEYLSERLNHLPKMVFSRTLVRAAWSPTTIVAASPVETVARLRHEPGQDLVVLGSSSVVSALLRAGLVDDFRLRIQPIILGAGRPLFANQSERHHLRLLSARTFDSGVVALRYEPERHAP